MQAHRRINYQTISAVMSSLPLYNRKMLHWQSHPQSRKHLPSYGFLVKKKKSSKSYPLHHQQDINAVSLPQQQLSFLLRCFLQQYLMKVMLVMAVSLGKVDSFPSSIRHGSESKRKKNISASSL